MYVVEHGVVQVIYWRSASNTAKGRLANFKVARTGFSSRPS